MTLTIRPYAEVIELANDFPLATLTATASGLVLYLPDDLTVVGLRRRAEVAS